MPIQRDFFRIWKAHDNLAMYLKDVLPVDKREVTLRVNAPAGDSGHDCPNTDHRQFPQQQENPALLSIPNRPNAHNGIEITRASDFPTYSYFFAV